MNFVEAVSSCLKKYATFSGRAPRSEFWFFRLFGWIVFVIGKILDHTVLQDYSYSYQAGSTMQQMGVASIILGLLFLLPDIAVSVRRLHDINKSGWWLLGITALVFVFAIIAAIIAVVIVIVLHAGAGVMGAPALIGITALIVLAPFLFLIYWFCKKGTEGDNRFGADPLAASA